MITRFACIFALAAFAAAPVLAAPDSPAAPKAPTAPIDLRGRFDALVDELAKKAAARGATRQDFARVVEEVRSAANEYMGERRVEQIRDKLIERINELEVKARDAQLMLMEFDVLKDLFIDLQCEGCVRRMAANVRAGKATRLEYAMVYQSLTLRAEAAMGWNPEIDAIIGRLRMEVEKLEKRAKEAMAALPATDLVPVMEAHADLMCRWVPVRLGKRAMQLKEIVVPKDFTDISETAAFYGIAPTSDLGRKIEARLEQLRAAVAGGRISRADFDELDALLKQRARAAVSGA
ncbi:MAG: hypothetical protein JNK02_14665 [Planctomycetes bacterium]|nr:hypothetical protein [Planctomycetota bacterium]